MNKDFSLKRDPQYDQGDLRSRINDSIKRARDDGDEVKNPQIKTMPIIPVTGGSQTNDKHFNNKSINKF